VRRPGHLRSGFVGRIVPGIAHGRGRKITATLRRMGVGIYRSGLQRGLPEFYLWESVSRFHETIAAQSNH
jgi:hypothetical protein